MNGSSDSQVIGRGGCARGLLGHACACARVLMCMLGCLSNLAVVGLRRKHSLLQWQEQGQFSASLSIPPPSFPCPVASRLRAKRCMQLRASGTSLQLCSKSGAGPWREVPFYSWPCSFTVPFLVHHALAAASWALTERQGCGACSGQRLW